MTRKPPLFFQKYPVLRPIDFTQCVFSKHFQIEIKKDQSTEERVVTRGIPKKSTVLSCAPLMVAVMLIPTVHAADEFTVNNRTEVVNNSVSGSGAASSFLDPGTHIFHESEIYRAAALANGWNSTLNATVRYTDSVQYDPDRFSIQKLEYRVNDASKSVTIGDYFANFSQYSMNKAIKGIGYQQNFGDDQNYLRAAYGTFDGQWAYVLRNSRTDEPMNRQVGGLRYQRQSEALTYGLNLATVRDSANNPKRRVGESAFEQTLPSFDWEYRSDAMTLSGEHAYSSTNEKTSIGASLDSHGMANKVTLRAPVGPANVDANLERVDTNFTSVAGPIQRMALIPDKIKLYSDMLAGFNKAGGSPAELEIKAMYQAFVQAYEGKNLNSLVRMLSRDWEAGDGTSREELQQNLRNNFRVFGTIQFKIDGLTITRSGQDFTVSYGVNMVGKIRQLGSTHEEKSTVKDTVTITPDGPRIVKTTGGRIWMK